MRITDCSNWLALIIALALPGWLVAQEPYAIKKVTLPSLDPAMRARLVALDRRLNPVHTPEMAVALAGQLATTNPFSGFAPLLADSRNNDVWEQLADEYYRMALESGGLLIPHADDQPARGTAWSSGQLRRLCHIRLTQLPRATLNQYRQRVDTEARSLLAEGKRKRSPIPLRRLVDDLFCSSVTDQALDLLGDLAFERGDFEEAEHWWRFLLPGVSPAELRYPDPRVDLARVHAKVILAKSFHGRLNEARDLLKAFQSQNPNAKGDLAGRTDRYAVIVHDTLNQLARKRLGNNDEPWTTFGGAASRSHVLSQAPSWSLIEDGPAWRVKLPSLAKDARESIIERGTLQRNVAFHPIIVQQQVLIADHRSVVSYHLTTGKELFRYDLAVAGLIDPGAGLDAKIAMPRFTLSADESRAYVRLGRFNVGPATEAGPTANYLVCIDLTEPGVAKKRELWHIKALSEDKKSVAFEGAPLVAGGRVYAVLSKTGDQRTLSTVVCYDTLGRERWSRDVCEGPEFEKYAEGPRGRQHLLTWADGQIVYCSHAGAIVALDAWTGQPTWGLRYPSRGPRTSELEPSPRDLTPALSSDGMVIAAPMDSERVFCIDARSGQVRWELDNLEIVHLLGAAHGKVFGTTRTGIVSIGMATGNVEWTQPIEGRLPSLGRGLLAGGWLIWPTEDPQLPYRAVTLRDGKLRAEAGSTVLPDPPFFEPSMMHALPAGNMAFGQGCLVIAGVSELSVFVPIHKQPMIPDVRPQAQLDIDYQKVRRLADAGETELAVQGYRKLKEATKAHPQAKAWQRLIDSRLQLLGEKPQPSALPLEVGPMSKSATSRTSALALPLVRAWEHDEDRVWPTDVDKDGFFFCTRDKTLACRALADGALSWRRTLAFAPTWVMRSHELVIAVSADGVQAMRVKDGQPIWTFAAPSRQWNVGSVVDGVPRMNDIARGLVQVEAGNDTLLVLDDHRQFYRLRLDTGDIAWKFALPSAELRPLAGGAFTSYFKSFDSQTFAQKTSGQAIWLGQKPQMFAEPTRLWRQAPAIVEQCMIYSAHPGRVDAYALKAPHDKRWSYQAPWPTSLAGESCRLIHHDSVLLALVPRNEGPELIRLNPERGQLLWSIPARQLRGGFDVESVCIGDTSFYYATAGKLHARSLNDGSAQWSLPLPSAQRWRIRYTKEALAVYPADDSPDREFSVDFVGPWNGELLQRLSFPDARGKGEVWWTPGALIVANGGKIYGFRSLPREEGVTWGEYSGSMNRFARRPVRETARDVFF